MTAPAPSARLLLRDGQKIGARFAFARGPFVQKINSQPPDPQSVEKLDRLEQAFLFERTIDIDTYDRHRDKLREELTLTQMDRHSSELEEMDVEGILAFAERVLPSAANLWVQSSLAQKQRLQQVFFPDGVRFDGKRLVGTGRTLPVFNYLGSVSDEKKELVDQTGIEPVTS